MAKIEARATLTVEVPIVLNEAEAAALDALASYNTDSFLAVFYESFGSSSLKPHEAGLRSLFDAVRATIPNALERAKSAREVFHGQRVAGQRVSIRETQ